MDRAKVRKLHKAIDGALKALARVHGFTYQPGSTSYNDLEVSGRMRFTLSGKEDQVAQRKVRPGHHPIGTCFTLSFERSGDKYEVKGYTTRGSVLIKRLRDSRELRLSPTQIPCMVLDGVILDLDRAATDRRPLAKLREEAILESMRQLCSRYSIECVTADGERSRTDQNRMVREGRRTWAEQVRLLGRKPTVAEIYPNSGVDGRTSNEPCEPEGLGL